MRTRNTHFDQIPVQTVTKIVSDPPTWVKIDGTQDEHSQRARRDARPCRCTSQKQDDGISGQENWRDLARKIQEESDPAKVIDLAQRLVNKLDEERESKKPLPLPHTLQRKQA